VCAGETFQHHTTNPFPFDTNSHLEKGQRLWRYDRCIYNPDRRFDLRYAWFVPDMAGFAPPVTNIEAKHYSEAQNPERLVLNSCIQYGNADALTTAQFLGDKAEKNLVDQEDQSACRPSPPVKNASPVSLTLEPIEFDMHLFFPSNLAKSYDTMLVLSAHYDIGIGTEGFSGTWLYKLSRLPGREEGDPASIVMEPILRGPAERLTRFFLEQNPGGRIVLRQEGKVQLFFVPSKNPTSLSWQLGQASLQFIDRSAKPVARAQIPIFIPAQ